MKPDITYCPHCWATISDSDTTCWSCGDRLESDVNVEQLKAPWDAYSPEANANREEIVNMSNFCNEDVVTARKERKCSECTNGIKKGDRYHRYKGCSDGDMFTVSMCCGCNSLLDWAYQFKFLDLGEFYFGELGVYLDGHDVFCCDGKMLAVSSETGVSVEHIKNVVR